MTDSSTQTALLGGGCFWCLEAVFQRLAGVHDVVSGYAGGHVDQPTYEEVCTGTTGHAEVVRITFDPNVIDFGGLLEVFFATHDPTTKDRQGADVGPQYRSVIFYTDESQHREAQAMIAALESEQVYDAPIVTELSPAPVFYPAEAYHRDYYTRNDTQPYCQIVIAPKLATLRQRFQQRLAASE